MENIYIAHHGIKGQKWGVRRFQYNNGNLTPEGQKRYGGNTSNIRRLLTSKKRFGSVERVQEKRDMLQAKIAKRGDKDFFTRNFRNDKLAGKAARLDRKIAHRQAKQEYLKNKTSENKRKLREARMRRFLFNGILSVKPEVEGKYKRHRQNGESVVDSVLSSSGEMLAGTVVTYAMSQMMTSIIRDAMKEATARS